MLLNIVLFASLSYTVLATFLAYKELNRQGMFTYILTWCIYFMFEQD